TQGGTSKFRMSRTRGRSMAKEIVVGVTRRSCRSPFSAVSGSTDSQGPQDFLRGDEAVAVEVEFAEVGHLLAAPPPLAERDLPVPVLVELLEPRRQALRQGAAGAVEDANRHREGAGPPAVLARGNDAVGAGPGGTVDDARGLVPAAAVVLGQEFAFR